MMEIYSCKLKPLFQSTWASLFTYCSSLDSSFKTIFVPIYTPNMFDKDFFFEICSYYKLHPINCLGGKLTPSGKSFFLYLELRPAVKTYGVS